MLRGDPSTATKSSKNKYEAEDNGNFSSSASVRPDWAIFYTSWPQIFFQK